LSKDIGHLVRFGDHRSMRRRDMHTRCHALPSLLSISCRMAPL
jgi:hypothetical protein